MVKPVSFSHHLVAVRGQRAPYTAVAKGFTIVELLIVVVVIAILAAITIVAYNGIQNNAKSSAAQSAAKQAYTKIQAYATQNAEVFPTSLSSAGITGGNGTTYQYQVNNAVTPAKFCVSARKDTAAFFITTSRSAPTQGNCYEQNMISTDINNWESGEYSQTTGNPVNNAARLRFREYIAVDPGAVYALATNTDSYHMVIRGYAQNQSFVTSIGGAPNGTNLTIPADVYYISVGLYGSTGATYTTYTQGFANNSMIPRITRNE